MSTSTTDDMQQETVSNGHSLWKKALGYGVLVFGLAVLCIALLRWSHLAAIVWLPNVVLFAVLLRSPGREWLQLASAGFAAFLGANLLMQTPVLTSVGFSLANMLEVILAASLVRSFADPFSRQFAPTAVLEVFAIYLFIAIPSGSLLASLFVAPVASSAWWHFLGGWLTSSVVGVLLWMIPALQMTRQKLAESLSGQNGLMMGGSFLAVVVLAAGLIWLDIFHFIYGAALLILFALYHGAFKTAIVANLTTLAIMVAMTAGWLKRPPVLADADNLWLWLATAFATAFPVITGLIADQLREKTRLLQASEARFKNAMEFAATGFVIADANGFLLEANNYFCKMVGYTREELQHITHQEITYPADFEVSTHKLRALLSDECQSYQLEKRYFHKDGHIIWTDVKVSRLASYDTDNLVIVQIDDITERRKQQQEILLLSDRLRLATDSVDMGVWDWNMQSLEVIWDARMREMYDLPEPQAPTYDLWRVRVHPEDVDAIEAVINDAISQHDSFKSGFRIIHPTQGVRYIQTAGLILRDDNKQPARMVGVNYDVTLQKQAELATEQARTELQIIIDHMPAIISYWDNRLRNRFANRSCRDWFGLNAEQMEGKTMKELLPDSFEQRKPYIIAALQGETVQFESQIVSRTGQLHYVLISYVPDFHHGEVVGFYVFINDYTPLKQAQLAREQAQALMQSVLDAASEYAIVSVDLSGTIMLFSKGAEQMLGYSAEEVLGKRTPALFHLAEEVNARRQQLAADTGQYIEGFDFFTHRVRMGLIEEGEWTYVRKNGRRFPGYLILTAMRNSRYEITGYVGVLKDVTEQKRTRQELLRAKEQAEQASRAKTEFVANMSHEIRTPMNAVLGMSYLLGNTALTIEQKKYLDMIRVSGQSLLGILNDILDFSKIEAGKMTLAPVDFHLDETLNALASMMTVNAGQKDLELAIGVDPDVPQMLIGDTLRLQQVLVNLAGNAIKFTEKGEVAVSVSLVEQREQDVVLRFLIRDTGIGMTAEQQSDLFQPFVQVDGSITRRFGGSGLGLTISKRLVELMGGEIGVSSKLGQGSEFYFTVVFQHSQRSLPVNRKPSIGTLRLLVVDDNQTSRSFIEHMIQTWGWHAVLAASGEEAVDLLNIELAAGHHFDVVLTDWQMPGMDGLAVALAVKTAAHRAPMPVMIMVSAFGRDALIHQKHIDKVDGILIKPVTSSSLYDTLHETLMQRRGPMDFHQVVAQTTIARRLDGAHLLLVEDNPLNQIVAKNILSQAGAFVGVVSDGQQAVDLLREHRNTYHLVLMDVQMPILDGYSATRLIREQLKLELPVIAMTAGVMDSERSQCRAAGMDDFIAKPLDVDEMLNTIIRYLPDTSTATKLDTPESSHKDGHAMNTEASIAGATGNVLNTTIFDGDAFLVMVGGDKTLQYELTQQFIDNYQAAATDISRFLADGDLGAANRLLHTIKGLSGTFKANDLSQAALDLEHELIERRQASVEGMARFTSQLQMAIVAMTDWLAENPLPKEAPALDSSLDPDAMQHLLMLLGQNNMSAFDIFGDLHAALGARLTMNELAEVDSAMNKLNFSRAREILSAWYQNYNKSH